MRLSKTWAMVALATAIALPAAAQKPDLSGTWKLNVQKSFLAGDHPDKDYGLTKIIALKDGALEMTDIAVHVSMMNIPMPDSKTVLELVADGKEHDATGASPFPGLPPTQLKVVVEWQGGTLLVTETGRGFGGQSTTQRRYYLSDDGTQLIELVEGHTGYGDTAQRLIFDKQP
jgi:hypothetical protein